MISLVHIQDSTERTTMGFQLSSLEPDTPISLFVSNDDNSMRFEATIKKVVKENLALIDILYESEQILNFNNVKIQVEYNPGETIPFVWRDAQIIYYHSEYVLRVSGDARKKNRRECFRVGVGHNAKMKTHTGQIKDVLIKDISLSGFAITDRKSELNLQPNDKVAISFEDLGHQIDLTGFLVRIEQREQMTIYGFEITNICRDLSSYVNCKQRQRGSGS